MKTKDCIFKKSDGAWNIVEQDAAGRVRIQCLSCGRLYPNENREPRAIAPNEEIVGRDCNPARRQQRLAAKAAKGDRQSASCPERCVNRAAAAQATLIAELNAAMLKAKEHELQSVLKRMRDHAERNLIPPELFRSAQGLALKQAIADGKAQEKTPETPQKTEHLGEAEELV